MAACTNLLIVAVVDGTGVDDLAEVRDTLAQWRTHGALPTGLRIELDAARIRAEFTATPAARTTTPRVSSLRSAGPAPSTASCAPPSGTVREAFTMGRLQGRRGDRPQAVTQRCRSMFPPDCAVDPGNRDRSHVQRLTSSTCGGRHRPSRRGVPSRSAQVS